MGTFSKFNVSRGWIWSQICISILFFPRDIFLRNRLTFYWLLAYYDSWKYKIQKTQSMPFEYKCFSFRTMVVFRTIWFPEIRSPFRRHCASRGYLLATHKLTAELHDSGTITPLFWSHYSLKQSHHGRSPDFVTNN